LFSILKSGKHSVLALQKTLYLRSYIGSICRHTCGLGNLCVINITCILQDLWVR